MRTSLICCLLSLTVSAGLARADGRPDLVIRPFTTAEGVSLPYDLDQLRTQLVAELNVMLGTEFDVRGSAPPESAPLVLEGRITRWQAGNAAKRALVGFGSGREAADVTFVVKDATGRTLLDRTETIRTNYYSQAAGSTGTLAHPLAQKLAEHLKRARPR